MPFTITPLVMAYGPQREKSRFTFLHNFGEKIDIPYVSWLLQDPDQNLNVLVDVGCSASQYAKHIKPIDSEALRHYGESFADVVDIKPLKQLLGDRGLGTVDIDFIIITHLDWDHCMNLTLFSDTKVYVQTREWEALPPHPLIATGFAPDSHYEEMERKGISLLDGDQELCPGLEVLFTPGHTPGGQSVAVETSRGRYIISGLCTIWENYYPDETASGNARYEVIPPGGHTDLFQAYDSVLRIRNEAGIKLFPNHDYTLFDQQPIG